MGQASPDSTPCPSKPSDLEKPIRGYAEKVGDDIIDRCLRTTPDSLGEAYNLYYLYFREHGFRIRYGKSRLNAEKTKYMQEIMCRCSVSVEQYNM
jgi:hypothetical protein